MLPSFCAVIKVFYIISLTSKAGKEKEGWKGRGKAPQKREGKAGRIFFWEASFPLHWLLVVALVVMMSL
jgi:hypothetical protein